MSAPTYDDARARIAADLAADERAYPGRSFMLIYRDDLRTLLAGPPEPSACPACYRGEVFGLSTDDGFWVEMGSSAGGANPHGINGWIELIEHHPDGRNVRREYIATDSPLASRPEPSVEEVAWQPIESAPTDGRSVLVFCPRASDHGYERIRLTWQKDGKWQGANNTSWPPTHWMPLPPAPQPE